MHNHTILLFISLFLLSSFFTNRTWTLPLPTADSRPEIPSSIVIRFALPVTSPSYHTSSEMSNLHFESIFMLYGHNKRRHI